MSDFKISPNYFDDDDDFNQDNTSVDEEDDDMSYSGPDNEIHLHLLINGRKKITAINGLTFKGGLKEQKEFISYVQQKLGTSGYVKKMEEIDPKREQICFQGDKRDDIINILVNKYGHSESNIHKHGV
jgi:translation initiation factor 1 (eIF-1/SUI1)